LYFPLMIFWNAVTGQRPLIAGFRLDTAMRTSLTL
jgi:hypothetical protein